MDISVLSIIVSLFSGAVGAAILEVWWKPRSIRLRIARLLIAEITSNTEYLLITHNYCMQKPTTMPDDFSLSTQAWEKAGANVSELDTDLLKKLILIYSLYNDLNEYVRKYMHYQEIKESYEYPRDNRSFDLSSIDYHLASILDIFHLTIEKGINNGKSLINLLLGTANYRISDDTGNKGKDYLKEVEKFLADREARLKLQMDTNINNK